MDKGFATFFYFGNKKVVFTSITPTPSSSIRNLFNCIHTPPICSKVFQFSLAVFYRILHRNIQSIDNLAFPSVHFISTVIKMPVRPP